MARRFTSPVGRFVQGDCFVPQTKDQKGNPRLVKNGPNIGQPSPQWYLGLAIAKNDPAWPAFYAELAAEAAAAWAHLFPQGANGPCVLPTFAWKIVDGDGFDTTGKPNNTKEGFAGHWVVRFSSGFQPRIVKPMGGGVWQDIANPAEAKRGWYVRVAGSTKSNEDASKPGLYMNMDMVEIVGYGPEIIGGPDAAAAFGGAPVALPPGASTMPVAPAAGPGGAPGYQGAPMAPAAPAYAPPPQAPVYAPPAAPPAPYGGYMATPAAPPMAPAAPAYAPPPQAPVYAPPAAPPAPPAPPPGPVHQMTALAQGQTYEAMIGAGWNDATLVQHGMMLPG